MTELLFKYYGIDWLNFLIVLVHIELLVQKKRSAFIWGFIATLFGLVFACMIGSVANCIMCITFLVFHVRAWIKWGQVVPILTKGEVPMSRD